MTLASLAVWAAGEVDSDPHTRPKKTTPGPPLVLSCVFTEHTNKMQRFPKAVLIPSLSPCDSSNRANRRRFLFRRPNRRALLISGGFTGAGGWGSLRLGRLVYILYTIRLGWSRLGLGLPKRLWSCGFLYLRELLPKDDGVRVLRRASVLPWPSAASPAASLSLSAAMA